jgi:ABC-type multidrug transport system fused ATPase/permease subunit
MNGVLYPYLIMKLNNMILSRDTQLRYGIYKHVSKLEMKVIEKYHSGDMLSRINDDMGSLFDFLSLGILNIFIIFINGLSPLVLIFYYSWQIGIFLIITGVLTLALNKYFSKNIREKTKLLSEQKSETNGLFIDIVSSLPIIKVFHINHKIMEDYDNKNKDLLTKNYELEKNRTKLDAITSLISNINSLGVLFLGAWFYIKGTLDIGTIIMIMMLKQYTMYFFISISNSIINLQNSLNAGDRLKEILDLPIESSNGNEDLIINEESLISLKNIKFSYDEKNTILNKLSLNMKSKQNIALVGPSGSGKSTIMKLLLKFYDIGRGKLKLNGKNIDNYSIKSLRNNISYVSQDSKLFIGTIKENIRYGKLDATDEEIIEAAKSANAHDFIINLPKGYDTEIEEGGQNLSGGQRQRISIARAILKDAPIVLLDEPTSALDPESEYLVQEGLERLMKDKTTIVVAHRLSTIKNSDVIYVLDKGKIIECGCHDELLEKNGLYKSLYELQ